MAITCPKCQSDNWKQTQRHPSLPDEDRFVCHSCGFGFKRYDPPIPKPTLGNNRDRGYLFAEVMATAAEQHAAATGDPNFLTNDLRIVIEEAVTLLQPDQYEAMKDRLRFRFQIVPEYLNLAALK